MRRSTARGRRRTPRATPSRSSTTAAGRTDDYDRLRQVAVADAELDDEEFDKLAAGTVDEELAALEDGIEAIDAALETYAVE